MFPTASIVWELNYRGTLEFLAQARAQASARQLVVVDGWMYFLHGWTAAIAEVFDIVIDESLFQRLERAATGT